MNNFYLVAAILTLLMVITHSLMGEKYFLVQLFQRDYYHDNQRAINLPLQGFDKINWSLKATIMQLFRCCFQLENKRKK